MIKSNELRILDYITHNGKINQIGGYIAFYNQYPHPMVNLINNSGQYGIHTIEPIKLTEEWLLNCGFKNIGYNEDCDVFSMPNNDFWIKKDDAGFFLDSYENARVIYVHQLQNLYFALCGEELVFSTEP